MSDRQAVAWFRRWSLIVAIIATVLLGAGILVAAYVWLIPTAADTEAAKGLTPSQRFTAAFAVATAVGAIVALVVNTRKQDLAEKVAASETIARDVERAATAASQFTERFAAAANQLGRPTAAERIAGVYAMAALADDYPDKRQQCVDVLCGYLRLPWNPALDETLSVTVDESWVVVDGRTVIRRTSPAHTAHDRIVRATILTVIRQHLLDPDADTTWCSLDYDFTGALLENASFQRATFNGDVTSFTEATFSGKRTSFGETTFSGETTSFDEATFSGETTSFGKATFSGKRTSFDRATFNGKRVWFADATFSGETTSFTEATFKTKGAWFAKATFSGESIWFARATFRGTTISFDGATFSAKRTSFDEATFEGMTISFEGATFRETTSFVGAIRNEELFDPSVSPE